MLLVVYGPLFVAYCVLFVVGCRFGVLLGVLFFLFVVYRIAFCVCSVCLLFVDSLFSVLFVVAVFVCCLLFDVLCCVCCPFLVVLYVV